MSDLKCKVKLLKRMAWSVTEIEKLSRPRVNERKTALPMTATGHLQTYGGFGLGVRFRAVSGHRRRRYVVGFV